MTNGVLLLLLLLMILRVRKRRTPQRFMRPFVIKALSPHIQSSLIAFSDGFQLAADVFVHALMPSVVLRMTRPTPFQIDSQHHPPSGQAAQAQHSLSTGKGRAVIAADCFGQSRDAQRSAQNFCAPFRSGHLPPHAPPRGNGCIHRAPLRAHSVARPFSTTP
jgi:hypothetical protein